MKIYKEFHQYRTAFVEERKLARNELQKWGKDAMWKKQKFDASNLLGNVKNHDEFEREVMNYNIFSMIFDHLKDVKEETLFPCKLFDGNEAWIGKDSVGRYRYFTGALFDEAIGYTIFDLLLCSEDVKGNGYTQQRRYVREELLSLLTSSYEDDKEWERNELGKYKENQRVLSILNNQDTQEENPRLFKKMKTYMDVLEKMLNHGQQYIDKSRKDENGNSYCVYYASRVGVSPSRFRNAIKRFRELGLLYTSQRKVNFFDKESHTTHEVTKTCISFPPYSEYLFRKIEKELATHK